MSRVHCIDCGTAVVVDPSGFCPDGHNIGADGARIDAAIGVAVPYPDEPEPWVASVDLVAGNGTATGDALSTEARAARPPSVPAGEPAFAAAARSTTPQPHTSAFGAPHDPTPPAVPATTPHSTNGHHASDSSDDLLRELHSLAELDDGASLAPPAVRVPTTSAPATSEPPTSSAPALARPTPPPASSPPPTATPEPAATGDEAHPPTDGQHRDGLAELRALETAVHALTGSSADELDDAAPEPPEAGNGVVHRLPAPEEAPPQDTPDRDQLAEVEQLFADRPRRVTTDEPGPRPSQTTPPAENEPPRPAFQRTPWSTGLDDDPSPAESPSATDPRPATGHPTMPPPAATAPPVAPRTQRSEAAGSSDTPLDLGNFTAKGDRVGARGERKRRRRGR